MERLSFKVPQKNKQIFFSCSANKIGTLLEEIKAINNFMVEKVRTLKCELSKKLEDGEEKIKQSKVYTFREFPYCFFSAKTLRNLLNF